MTSTATRVADRFAQNLRAAKSQKVKRFTQDQLDAMAPGKLDQEEKKARDISSALGDELIEAGRGHETASETRDKAKQGDELAKRWVDAADALADLLWEKKRRMEYQGNTKRIKKSPW